MTILIAGGHLTPALALIQKLHQHHIQVVYVGQESGSSAQHISREKQLVQSTNATFTSLPIVKWDRYRGFGNIFTIPKLITSVRLSISLIHQFKPNVVVGFGGFLTVPLGLAAWLTRTKLVLHEQTTQAGAANRFAATFASKVAVSYQSSQKYFPSHKVVITGNLLRQEFFHPITKPASLPTLTKPWIFISGGSQGSLYINQVLEVVAPSLINDMCIVHQYGNQQPLESIASHPHYLAKSWFDTSEYVYLLSHAKLSISRAGANTVSEIIALATPSILIPLKGSQQHEQDYNAALICQSQSGICLNQETCDADSLIAAIREIEKRHKWFSQNAKNNKLRTTKDSVELFCTLLV